MIKNIKAKTLLSSKKEGIDDYFGIRYTMNLYLAASSDAFTAIQEAPATG